MEPAPGRLVPPNLTAELAFAEPSGNDALDGGEKAVLMVTIANAGPGAAQDLHVTVKRVTMAGLRAPRKQAIGSLAAGASVTVSVPLEAVEEIASGQARLELGVEEKNGFDADSVAIEFETRAIKLPKLEVASVSLGGGGIVKLATVMPMEVVIKNAGTAAAKDVVATLVVGDQDIVISGDTTAAVGALEPGQSRSVSFEFFVKRRYAGANNLPVTVTLAEATGKRGLAEASLRLVMGKTAPSLKVVSIKGKAQVVAAVDAFADVDTPPETLAVVDPDAFGVVIGIEKYRQEGIPAVDFAARDAQSIYNYLTRSMGFDAKNVVLLQNDRAARSDMMKYLGSWLKNRATSEEPGLHLLRRPRRAGPKAAETYLIPYDGDPSYTEETLCQAALRSAGQASHQGTSRWRLMPSPGRRPLVIARGPALGHRDRGAFDRREYGRVVGHQRGSDQHFLPRRSARADDLFPAQGAQGRRRCGRRRRHHDGRDLLLCEIPRRTGGAQSERRTGPEPEPRSRAAGRARQPGLAEAQIALQPRQQPVLGAEHFLLLAGRPVVVAQQMQGAVDDQRQHLLEHGVAQPVGLDAGLVG